MPFLLDLSPTLRHSVAACGRHGLPCRLPCISMQCLFLCLFFRFLMSCIFSVWIFQGTPASLMLATGDGEIRTLDPLLARQVLSQLSYAPMALSLLILADCSSSSKIFDMLFFFF